MSDRGLWICRPTRTAGVAIERLRDRRYEEICIYETLRRRNGQTEQDGKQRGKQQNILGGKEHPTNAVHVCVAFYLVA